MTIAVLCEHTVEYLRKLDYTPDTFSNAVNHMVCQYSKSKLKCLDGLHCETDKMKKKEKDYVDVIEKVSARTEPNTTEPNISTPKTNEIGNKNRKVVGVTNDAKETEKSKTRDKATKDKGLFFCSRCQRMHNRGSPCGKKHIIYETSEISPEYLVRKANHTLRMRITKLKKRPDVNNSQIKKLEAELTEIVEQPVIKTKVVVEPEEKAEKIIDDSGSRFRAFYRGHLC